MCYTLVMMLKKKQFFRYYNIEVVDKCHVAIIRLS